MASFLELERNLRFPAVAPALRTLLAAKELRIVTMEGEFPRIVTSFGLSGDVLLWVDAKQLLLLDEVRRHALMTAHQAVVDEAFAELGRAWSLVAALILALRLIPASFGLVHWVQGAATGSLLTFALALLPRRLLLLPFSWAGRYYARHLLSGGRVSAN